MNESETKLEEHPADFIGIYPEEIGGEETGRSLIDVWQNGKQICIFATAAETAEILYAMLSDGRIELLPAPSYKPEVAH